MRMLNRYHTTTQRHRIVEDRAKMNAEDIMIEITHQRQQSFRLVVVDAVFSSVGSSIPWSDRENALNYNRSVQ